MTLIRRVFYIIASLVLLVLLFVALVLFAPTMAQPVVAPARAWLLRTVSAQVSKSINGSLSIGSLEGSLLSAPTIRDVVLKDAQNDVVMQLQALRLRYDLTQLLHRKLLVHDIAIVKPRAKVVQEADGSLNWSRLFPPSNTPPKNASWGFMIPLDIELTALTVENGQAELDLPALPGVHTVKDLNLQVRGARSKERYDIELQQLTAKTLPAAVNLKTLRVAWQQIGSDIQIKDFQLHTDTSHIAIQGALPGGTQPANLTVRIEPFDMAEVGRLLADNTLSGLLQAQMTAEGPPEALHVSGHISAEGGEVALNGNLNTAAASPAYEAALDITKLNIAALIHRGSLESDLNLHLAMRGSGLSPKQFQGDARVQILPSTFGDITLNPSNIHVTAQGQRIDVQQFHLDTSVAQMSVDGLLDLAGDSTLHYDLQVQLADLRQLLGTDALDGTAHWQGEASGTWPDLTTSGTLKARGLRYDANQLQGVAVTYEASQLGAEPRATTQIRLQKAQLGTFPVAQLDLHATYDHATSQLQFITDVVQSADCDGTLSGRLILTAPDKLIRLDTVRIRLQDHTWSAPQPLDVALGANGFNVNHVHLAHDDESITASGRLEGSKFDNLRVHASNIDLDFLRTMLALPELVSGQASLDATLSGTMEDPQFKTDLQVRGPHHPSPPFEDIRVTLDYAQPQLKGQIQVRQQEREVIDLNLRLPAHVVLNELSPARLLVDAPVAIHLQMNQPDLRSLQRALPTLPPLAGTVQADIDLQGTYAQLILHSTIELRQFGLVGTIENVNAPLQLTGTIVTAKSVAALAQALADGTPSAAIRDLTLDAPSMAGQLPSAGRGVQPLRVNHLALRADAQWSGKANQTFEATLHTLALQAQAFDLPDTQLNLAAAMTADRLDVKRLEITSAGSELSGKGHMILQDQSVQFSLAIPRLRLSDFVPTLPENMPKDIQGTIDVAGRTQAPEVAVHLGYAGARIEADLAAELQKALPSYQGNLTIEALDVAPFMPDLSGIINARMRFNGEGFDGKNRRANVALDLDSQHFALAPGLTTELRAQLQGNAVQLDTLYVRSEPLTFDAGGSLSDGRRATLTYTLTLGDLTSIRQQLGLDLDVKGQLRGKLSGALNALSAEGILQLEPWRYAAWHGKSIHATFNAQELTTRPQAEFEAKIADAAGPSLEPSSVELEGTYNTDRGRFDVRVTEGPFQHTRITGKAALAGGQDLTLTTLNLQRGDWNWSNPKPIRVRRDAGGRLEVSDFELRNGQQAILAQATLPPRGPIAGHVRIDQLHISPNVKALAPDVVVPDGYVQLDMKLNGTLQEPGADGVLQLTGLAWQKRQLGKLEAQFDLAQNTLSSDVHWRDQQTDLLRLQGTVGLDAAGALDMTVKSRQFDLSRLPSYTDAVQQSAGEFNLDLHLSGTVHQPEMNGQLDLANGVLQLPATGESYQDIGTQITFAGKRITLEALHVASRTGTLNLKGWMELAGRGLKKLDFTMAADNFTAINTQDIEAVLNANLSAKGSLEALAVNGNVNIPRAKVRIEDFLGSGPATVKPKQLTVEGVYGSGTKAADRKNGAKPAVRQANPLPFLQANVKINMPRNVWVQAPGTAIELNGDLQVTKALQKPIIIAGDITTVRGFVSYLGRKFTLEQGRITFTGTEEINPTLDITASYVVSDYTVTIHVQGTSKMPTINLSSAPEALEQADIISLLVFGRTTDKLTSSEQGSLGTKVQNVALGAAAGKAASIVGEQLGLDTVEVEVGDNPSQTRLGAGKYITQDLFVAYERQLGKEGGNTVDVEYSINQRLKLKGSSSDTGETAVDLIWRKDY
jgi:autotransporter translocation and assembly factor TamB